MAKRWRYRNTLLVAIIGLLMVVSGLSMGLLSDPSRFSINVRDDQNIHRLVLGAIITTGLGIGIFLKAVSQTTHAIPPKQRKEINVALSIGLLLQLGAVTRQHMPSLALLLLMSVPLFVWGCMHYAAAKGHSKRWSVLGILGVLGLIVLVLLPDRNPRPHVAACDEIPVDGKSNETICCDKTRKNS